MSRLQREPAGAKRFEKARSLSSLRRCAGTRAEEGMKEAIADEMLRGAELEKSRPARSEAALAAAERGRCVIRIDDIAERLISTRPSQSALDELKFLMGLTPLTRQERYFLRGWILGWTQEETNVRWIDQFGPMRRATVSRTLRCALDKCGQNAPISFSAFSRHAVYRKPAHRRETYRMSRCANCSEQYIRSFGDGPYCTSSCRCAAISRYLERGR
jgi:hypothetical protein